ncbi:hypothetical protein [Aliivibrio fischeri]|nr:hypothetical protein [Aliivibrio fischeri]MUI52920.1 hypothetical protein [Aliivibrio fischeri]MUJ36825.1 hypothetical protein [Aliivibrio fischeri]
MTILLRIFIITLYKNDYELATLDDNNLFGSNEKGYIDYPIYCKKQ